MHRYGRAGGGAALLRNYTAGPDGSLANGGALFRLIESCYPISRIADRRERARWDDSGMKVGGEQALVTPTSFLQRPPFERLFWTIDLDAGYRADIN